MDTNEFPDYRPQLAIEVPDDDGTLLGYLAVDSVVSGRCCGGIRMGADVTPGEIRGLAHAMSHKFAFMNMPIGGAKSGIFCPADADTEERVRRLETFGRRLSPVLRGFYATGGDIGVGPEDVAIVKRSAGMPVKIHAGSYRGGYYTAFGVYVSIMTWLAHTGISASDATVLLQGYGKVGQPLARQLADSDVRIAGVSTSAGAIYAADGLDIEKLEELTRKYGDECVREYKGADHEIAESLFSHPATIAVPGARAWAINESNVDSIKVRSVISAANIPVTPRSTVKLENRGTMVVPDYVSNSAGIFACGLLRQGFTEQMTTDVVTRIYRDRLRALLEIHDETARTLGEIAVLSCERNLEQLRATRRSKLAWFRAKLSEERGWSRIAERAAMELYIGASRMPGGQRWPLGFLRHGAVQGMYHRAVKPLNL
jgi:glutamate dehydrogenase/leucine dehydrogenase